MPIVHSTSIRILFLLIVAIGSSLLHAQSPSAASGPDSLSSFIARRSSLDWNPTPIVRQPRLGTSWGAAFSPDGTLAATGHDGAAMVWRAATGDSVAKLVGFRSRVTGVAFDGSGEHLFAADLRGVILVWSTATWTVVDSLNRGYQSFLLRRLVVTPDGRKAFFSGRDLPVTLWDRTTRQVTRLENYTDTHAADTAGHSALGLDISSDGSTLVAFSTYNLLDTARFPLNNVIEFWRVDDGRLFRSFDRGMTSRLYEESIALSPDMSRLAVPSSGNLIWYFDTETGRLVRYVKANSSIEVVRYNRDGSMIASVGFRDGVIILDPVTDSVLAHLSPDDSTYYLSLAISPDGKRVIAGNFDGVVKIWSRLDASVEREASAARAASLDYRRDGSAIVLDYELPRSGDARVLLCDLLGREIMVIDEGWREAGPHTLRFDAAGIPSGIYLCALRTSSGAVTQRVPIVR